MVGNGFAVGRKVGTGVIVETAIPIAFNGDVAGVIVAVAAGCGVPQALNTNSANNSINPVFEKRTN